MNSLKLITHNNEFVVRDISKPEHFLLPDYNITNTKEEIFQMWEEANRINLAEKYSYKSINEREERELEFIAFVTGYKSNPYNWTDEELEGAYLMGGATDYSLVHVKEKLLMQRIKECFVEVERESPSKSFGAHVERFMTGKTPIKLYPNNSVRVTKIIL